jgi:hypothetical protein
MPSKLGQIHNLCEDDRDWESLNIEDLKEVEDEKCVAGDFDTDGGGRGCAVTANN